MDKRLTKNGKVLKYNTVSLSLSKVGVETFTPRAKPRIYEFRTDREPVQARSLEDFEGVLNRLEELTWHLGLTLKRAYEGESVLHARSQTDRPQKGPPKVGTSRSKRASAQRRNTHGGPLGTWNR